MAAARKRVVVFCDFDGTITTEDMIVGVWKQFAPPMWEGEVRDIFAGKQTLKDGVNNVFSQIESSKREEIIAYVQRIMKVRQGFDDFLDFCGDSGLEFTVCSGGIDFFMVPALAPYQSRIKKTYTLHADLSGKNLRLEFPLTCGSCGLCKAKVMESYPGAFKILIGDSLTDVHGAEKADLVFARSKLRDVLSEKGRAFEAFETFDEIRETLTKKYPKLLTIGKNAP